MREFYAFQDLKAGIVRSDFAAYLLFGEKQLVTRWLTDEIAPHDAPENATNVKLKFGWWHPDSSSSSSMYSFGKRLLVHEYVRIVLSAEGFVKNASRYALCGSFLARFPEFGHDRSVLLVNPSVWERVDRNLPELLRQFSGGAVGSTGEIEVLFCKDVVDRFIPRRDS